jgi:cobalt-zinc-cadmium efflux system membrane fusion protein
LVALLSLTFVACQQKDSKPASDPIAATITPPKRDSALIKLPPDSPQLERIRSVVVQSDMVPQEEIVAPGKVEMNPNRVSKIVMPVAGRVRRVLVGLGDSVQQGQLLVTLESPEVGAIMTAYRQAQSNIAQGKAGVAKAEADLNRVRDLHANRAIAQKEVLSAETVLVQMRAVVEQAQASLDEARRRLQILGLDAGSVDQHITVPATVSGKVIDIAVVPGEFRNDTSAPIMTIADLSSVWVAADVPEALIRFVSVGERVAISFGAFPGETFSGRIARISDLLDPQTRTVKVRAELKNPGGRLRPEMFAQIRQNRGTQRLPIVPRGAVLQAEGRSTVFVERAKGEYQEVPVTIAWQEGDRIALSSVVQQGDRVVVEGVMLLKGYQGDLR